MALFLIDRTCCLGGFWAYPLKSSWRYQTHHQGLIQVFLISDSRCFGIFDVVFAALAVCLFSECPASIELEQAFRSHSTTRIDRNWCGFYSLEWSACAGAFKPGYPEVIPYSAHQTMINHPSSVVEHLVCSDVLRGLLRGFHHVAVPRQSSIASTTVCLAAWLLYLCMTDPRFTALALPTQRVTLLRFSNYASFKTTARSRSFWIFLLYYYITFRLR